ncbi:MAG: chromosome segregation protein SMC [Gemmatimonadota bacterium]|nr:chromosome segregation protein SMC [Gemmatimonadota bacterium]
MEFHDGITAVVGPNGCGKSNISDAIRWVLGEQRPTAIRGAKMEEAIFQGTTGRRPVNRGAVSLSVSNEDGLLPVPFEEVELGRQVFRDGGSEYSINRSPCRLRDVVDLCRDTGLGANAYAIIENRMIDAILSDRADERRGLFEEAAGIGKYKDRRKAAIRRLERAEMDLQRLEDVIGEVHTKVRSLARQKGKAERYTEYRKRRLDVEVSVVRHQLDTLAQRLEKVDEDLKGDVYTAEGMVAELRTAETQFESLRLRQVDVEKERSAAAQVLETIREQLVKWERDLAVAEERSTYAERRLAQIDRERTDARTQVTALEAQELGLTGDRDRIATELDGVTEVATARGETAQEVRDRLQAARDALEAVETRARELSRKGAQLEGDAQASEAQAEELERRLSHVTGELESTADVLSELASQGDLFSSRVDDLGDVLRRANAELDVTVAALGAARSEFEAARQHERETSDRLAGLSARQAALEGLEREREGLEPVVRAALAVGDPGVIGPLSDFLESASDATEAAEAYLGPLASALVVEDGATVERLLLWFGESWSGGGGLTLLRLDRTPPYAARASGSLLDRVEPRGAGAPWVRALLDGVEVPASSSRGRPVTEREGIVRVGDPAKGSGVLERRKELAAISREHAGAERTHAAAAERLARAEAMLVAAEGALEGARLGRLQAEDQHRLVTSELADQTDRRGRVDRHRDELARQLEGARATRTRALERAKEAREDRRVLVEQEEALESERGEARAVLERVQEEWEAARAEEARLAVEVTRLGGDLARVAERLEAATASRTHATTRVETLDVEEKQLRDELAEARKVRTEGDQATERLFGERTEAEAELRRRDEVLEGVAIQLAAAELHVREVRTAERAASDHRHGLELERQELKGRIERIRERLEGEWGRSLESLLTEAAPVEGEQEALQAELSELVIALERLGPVNMLAVEEHAEETQRLEFLTGQREDLVSARNDLRSAIREINKTATDLFVTTFDAIRVNFRATFVRLFEGGEADIWLENEEDPLESPIEIHASPRGKRTQRIDLLSGGERALTALSLLFGIYLVKPSPFCVLDEVDAPLDENNIGRFIKLLQDFKAQTQFVVITHNPRTIEAADWIYGVTMEEPGVSTIVGVKLSEALEVAGVA